MASCAQIIISSIHDVLGEPFAPFGGLLRAQLVIDDDRLRAPLLRRGENAREVGDGGVDLGIGDHRAAFLELGDLRLHLRVERDVDELVGEVGLLRALHDGDGVDAEHGAFLGDRERDRHAFSGHVVRIHRQDHLYRRLAVGDELLAVGVVGVERLEARLELLELGLPFLPGRGVAAREQRRHGDEVARVEVRCRELSLDLRLPEVRPAREGHAFDEVRAVADRIDIGPGADVIRADLGLLDQVLGVRHFDEIQRLVEPVIGIKPADVRRGESDVAFGIALGELLLVEPVDGAAGDEFDRHTGLGCEALADDLGHHVAPAATPDAHRELVLRQRRQRRQHEHNAQETADCGNPSHI